MFHIEKAYIPSNLVWSTTGVCKLQSEGVKSGRLPLLVMSLLTTVCTFLSGWGGIHGRILHAIWKYRWNSDGGAMNKVLFGCSPACSVMGMLAAFMLQRLSGVVLAETMCPDKSKIFAIWPFPENVCDTWSWTTFYVLLIWPSSCPDAHTQSPIAVLNHTNMVLIREDPKLSDASNSGERKREAAILKPLALVRPGTVLHTEQLFP